MRSAKTASTEPGAQRADVRTLITAIGQVVSGDIDAPLINIFDEEQLCERLRRTNPETAQQVCR